MRNILITIKYIYHSKERREEKREIDLVFSVDKVKRYDNRTNKES